MQRAGVFRSVGWFGSFVAAFVIAICHCVYVMKIVSS